MATDNRNIDYATKYKKELDQAFSEASLTEAYVSHENAFKEDGGVASVYFRTVDTSDFLQQHTSPVFADPTAVGSDVVRKDITLFYQINKVIPSVDTDDTSGALSAAGEILNAGIREQYGPFMDKLRMSTAIAAATAYAGANKVTYTAANGIMKGIDSMIAALKNVRSYAKTQALFIPASMEAELDTSLFSIYAPNKNDSIVSTGVIGKYKGIDVVVLPDEIFCTATVSGTAPYQKATFTADSKIKAVLWDKRVMKDCRKLYKTYVLTGKSAITAGADGPVLRGLFRPGCWAIDANGTNKAVAILASAS